MLTALYGYSMGLLMFALAGEATTVWLRWLGVAAAVWFIVIGSLLGWQAARK